MTALARARVSPIEIRIRPEKIPKWAHGVVQAETWAVGELKRAGIPVRGVLIFSGLEGGTLTRSDDPETGEIVYRWLP